MFFRHCERSEAIDATARRRIDRFVASLLAMTAFVVRRDDTKNHPARFFARPISLRNACNSLRTALAASRSILR